MEITVSEFYNSYKKIDDTTRFLVEDIGLENKISSEYPVFSGLLLTGYFTSFKSGTIQIFGETEIDFLINIYNNSKLLSIDKYLENKIPCIVISEKNEIPVKYIDKCIKKNIAVILTKHSANDFYMQCSRFLVNLFAPQKIVQGVLIDVSGVGIILIGESGVGKSECALELIRRGHRLVADDVVYVKKIGTRLEGTTPKTIEHRMEIRGIGIIDIFRLFGAHAIRERKTIELIVKLEKWDENKYYDRTGLETEYFEIMGLKLAMLTIPIQPGRHIPSIIEAVATNFRLEKIGYNTPEDFEERFFEINKLKSQGISAEIEIDQDNLD